VHPLRWTPHMAATTTAAHLTLTLTCPTPHDNGLPQNEEQLNNLLKTLDGYYSNEDLRRRCPAAARHQGEFLGYFLLMQLGNGGEVAKFLQQLAGQPALASTDVQFAVQVTTPPPPPPP